MDDKQKRPAGDKRAAPGQTDEPQTTTPQIDDNQDDLGRDINDPSRPSGKTGTAEGGK